MSKVNKSPAIIVDLDGTLCDVDHKKHLLGTDEWYNLIIEDKINDWCLQIVETAQSRNIAIIFLTARTFSPKTEKLTKAWLTKNQISYDLLIGRPEGNLEPDEVFKRTAYCEQIKPHYQVLAAVDDLPRVARMWVEEDIPTHCCGGTDG